MAWSSELVIQACEEAGEPKYGKITLRRGSEDTSAWTREICEAWDAWEARYGVGPPFAYWRCPSETPWVLSSGDDVILLNEPVIPVWRYRDVLRLRSDGSWELVYRTYPKRLLVRYDETPWGMRSNPTKFAQLAQETGVSISSPAPGLLSALLREDHDPQEILVRLSGVLSLTRAFDVVEHDSVLRLNDLGRIWGDPQAH